MDREEDPVNIVLVVKEQINKLTADQWRQQTKELLKDIATLKMFTGKQPKITV